MPRRKTDAAGEGSAGPSGGAAGRRAAIRALGAVALAALLVPLAVPKLVSGDVCDLTITRVRVDASGRVRIETRGRATAGTSLGATSRREGERPGSESGRGAIVPGWPRPICPTADFRLASDEEESSGIHDSPELRRRILVAEGETYRLRNHDRLVLFRRPNPDGSADLACFEVNPEG